MNYRNVNVKHKTKHLVLRPAGCAASEVVTVLAWTKQNPMQPGHIVMKQANIINMITNKYEPQQKHWSVKQNKKKKKKKQNKKKKKKNTGGLISVLWIPTSPSASVMARNIQLFGRREGFLTRQ